jgi:hypothetical protein
MQEVILGSLGGLGGMAYLFQTFFQEKEKMNGVNEQIVLALEGAGIAIGFDADGDVTVHHVVTAIRSLNDRLREAETSTRTLRRFHARADQQRARAVLKVADLEAQLRACKDLQQEFDRLVREGNELARQLREANNVLKRREEAAQDFLKMQREKSTRAKKTRKKRR